MARDATVLVLGFGNPARRDDGLGPALAARLAERELPGVRVEAAYQLNVEDAERVARHDVVVFVDACRSSLLPFELQALEPRAGALEFSTHALSPEAVLGLAHELFGARTRGFTLGVRGYAFAELREELTAAAAANLEAAAEWLADALRAGARPGPAAPTPAGGAA